MKRIQPLVFVVAGMLLAGGVEQAGATLVATFTGDFAPANWTAGGTGGSASAFGTTAQGYGTLDWTAPASGAYASSLSVTAQTSSYEFAFTYTLTKNGDTGSPEVAYEVETPGDTVFNGESGTLGVGSGGENLEIPYGDTLVFDFIGSGTAPGKDPATFDMTLIPEAGTWLAGVFILSVVGLTVLRRKLARR